MEISQLKTENQIKTAQKIKDNVVLTYQNNIFVLIIGEFVLNYLFNINLPKIVGKLILKRVILYLNK